MFTTTEKMNQDGRIVVLVYGPPKVGKTKLATTCPGKVLIVNMENGLLSLKGDNVDVYDCTVDKDGEPMNRVFRFKKLIHLFENVLSKDEMKKKYDWIFIDSLTEIGQCLVETMKEKYPDKKDSLVLWGEYSEKITDLVKQMRDYKPYNIIFTALEVWDKDDQGRRFTGVDLNGKISQRVPSLVDEIFHYRIFDKEDGSQVRKLITSTYDKAIAGDRSGKLDQFENPNIGQIVKKIKNVTNK